MMERKRIYPKEKNIERDPLKWKGIKIMEDDTNTNCVEPAFSNLDDETIAILVEDKIATGG